MEVKKEQENIHFVRRAAEEKKDPLLLKGRGYIPISYHHTFDGLHVSGLAAPWSSGSLLSNEAAQQNVDGGKSSIDMSKLKLN